MSLCPHNSKISTHLLPHGRTAVQSESVPMAERQYGGGKKNASTPVQAPASAWLFLVIPHGFRCFAIPLSVVCHCRSTAGRLTPRRFAIWSFKSLMRRWSRQSERERPDGGAAMQRQREERLHSRASTGFRLALSRDSAWLSPCCPLFALRGLLPLPAHKGACHKVLPPLPCKHRLPPGFFS